MDIELCVASFEEALLAQQYQLKRIELCSALEVGGLTPSAGLIKKCAQIENLEIHVMVRPRPGNFVYSPGEIQIMLTDIETVAELGSDGIVFGCLTSHSAPDPGSVKQLTEAAKAHGLEITFHRAFDVVRNPLESLELLAELNFDRVLTSGQQPKAEDGLTQISSMVEQAKGRVQIMAGSGVNADNAKLFEDIGVDAIHFTARQKQNEWNNLNMGDCYVPDPEKIESVLNALAATH